jgi:hypothetical protein
MSGTIQLVRRGNDWVAYFWGKSAPVLRPVPGNTVPARAALWPSREAAITELEAWFGTIKIMGGP